MLEPSLHLETAVVHDSDIADRTRFADILVDRDLHQHAVRLLIIPVDGKGKLVIEETKVEAEVSLDAFLPAEVRVGKTAGLDTLNGRLPLSEDVVVLRRSQDSIAEITYGFITVLTPGEAELGIVDPCGHVVLEEALLVDVPPQGEGREGRPFVVGAEAGGTVPADRELGHIALVEVIIGTEEIRRQTGGDIWSAVDAHPAVFLESGRIVDIGLVVPFFRKVIAGSADLLASGSLGTLAQEDGEAVTADFLIISQGVFNLPDGGGGAESVGVAVGRLVVAAQIEKRGISFIAPEAEVDAVGRPELQVVPDLEFTGETGDELVAPSLVPRQGHTRDRVDHFVVVHPRDHKKLPVRIAEQGLAGIQGSILLCLVLGRKDSEDRGKRQGGTERRAPLGVFRHADRVDIRIGKVACQNKLVQEISFLAAV